MQTAASVETGYWYARSPEFLHTDIMRTLRWLRVPGDTLFALGAVALVWFVAGLKSGHSLTGGTGDAPRATESKPGS
jgi:nitric oxide reductase subunit B